MSAELFHTPLPWKRCGRVLFTDHIRGPLSLLGADGIGTYVIFIEDDAKLIMQAVNSYYQTLQTLKDTLAELESDGAGENTLAGMEMVASLRSAIKAATAEHPETSL